MISVCIVNWNTRDHLRECLLALEANPPDEEMEVIVVDNASPDDSADMVRTEFPRVELVSNRRNLLYAKATNQALNKARGDLVFLLNPDTRVREGCVGRLAAFLRGNDLAGAAAPRLYWPDGRIQRSCRSFPSPKVLLADIAGFARLRPVTRDYRMRGFSYDRVAEVDQPMASALMLKSAALDQVGLLDEGFPMFFNDVDLCLRLRQAGWKIFFVPEAEATHYHGSSTRQRKREMIIHSHASLLRFYRKHYWGRTNVVCYLLVTILGRAGKYLRLAGAR